MLCWLTRRPGLICCFCSSAHSFALQLPSDGSSRFRPCFRLILVLTVTLLTGFTYRGLAPHKFTPMPGVHKRVNRTARVCFFLKVEKFLNYVLSINFFGNPCRPLPKRYILSKYIAQYLILMIFFVYSRFVCQ